MNVSASTAMTSKERILRAIEHRETDRVPIVEKPWPATLERWRREGLGDKTPEEYFGLDQIVPLRVDNSPRFPNDVIEETDDYKVVRTKWGMTEKKWKHKGGTPLKLESAITTPDDWLEAKQRMTYNEDRIPWDQLKNNWKKWQENGAFIQATGWFGFDVTHSHIIGTENALMALIENPEWLVDMWHTQQNLNLSLLDRVWDEGYKFDGLRWPDDMGYKLSQFFSVDMYRELLKPIHQRAVEWAHAKGISASLHSCGDIRPFIPDLVEIGVDCLNPLEVKAGVDPLAVKEEFGDRLALHGGFDALLWHDLDKMAEAVKTNLPLLRKGGGYIFATDHSTPDEVSLNDFQRIIDLVKEAGGY
ncbi:MAG: uroporphyrinogen decarboxylase family protein [Lentisphaeria bacterium]